MDKIREIAVLKLIGTRNRTIAWMILQQALALGLIGFAVGKISSTFAAPYFPKYVCIGSARFYFWIYCGDADLHVSQFGCNSDGTAH